MNFAKNIFFNRTPTGDYFFIELTLIYQQTKYSKFKLIYNKLYKQTNNLQYFRKTTLIGKPMFCLAQRNTFIVVVKVSKCARVYG